MGTSSAMSDATKDRSAHAAYWAYTPGVRGTPAHHETRRAAAVELRERLRRCETLLARHYDDAQMESPVPRPSMTPGSCSVGDEQHRRGLGVKGTVLHDGDLWDNIYQEIQSMSALLGNGTTSNLGDSTTTSYAAKGRSAAASLFPEPSQAMRLWQIFLERVDPLIKILHVPSVQPLVVESIAAPDTISKPTCALLFSVYALAVTSLGEIECYEKFGWDRASTVAKLTAGMHEALRGIAFPGEYTIPAIQALVFHMVVLQEQLDHQSSWAIAGLVLRLAQRIGLHKDSEALRLGPFETEMRRRLWWAIVGLDMKSAILTGLGSSPLPPEWDTRLPSNVNDADLYPSGTQTVQDRDGPTEMAFCLLQYNVVHTILRFGHSHALQLLQGQLQHGALGPWHDMINHLVDSIRASADPVVARFCDRSAGPVHEFAMDLHELLSRGSADLVGLLAAPAVSDPSQEALLLATNCMGLVLRAHEVGESRGFLWYMRSLFHKNMFASLVAALSDSGVQADLLDEIWAVVREAYRYHPGLSAL